MRFNAGESGKCGWGLHSLPSWKPFIILFLFNCRCVDIGKYAMIGSSVRTCIYSEWSGQKPSCFGLNQENDYASEYLKVRIEFLFPLNAISQPLIVEKPPTILIRHQNGPISQSNDGKLIVYPGTTLHMECLWMRRFGNPRWNVSHDYRKYPEGWSMDEGRDPQLEYRLSILHAVKDDSGTFTCVTPARHTHSVDIIVKVSSESDCVNSIAHFECFSVRALPRCGPTKRLISEYNWHPDEHPRCFALYKWKRPDWGTGDCLSALGKLECALTGMRECRVRRRATEQFIKWLFATCCYSVTWGWWAGSILLPGWLWFERTFGGYLFANRGMGWTFPILCWWVERLLHFRLSFLFHSFNYRGPMFPSWCPTEWLRSRSTAIQSWGRGAVQLQSRVYDARTANYRLPGQWKMVRCLAKM